MGHQTDNNQYQMETQSDKLEQKDTQIQHDLSTVLSSITLENQRFARFRSNL